MKSTIKIGRDENDKPAIIIRAVNDSEDLRDETIRKFIENLNHSSCFCLIECVHATPALDFNESSSIWHIKPVGTIDELKSLKTRLDETIRVLENTKS